MSANTDVLALLAQDLAATSPGTFWLWTTLGLIAAIASFITAFAALHRARLIENTPTSRIRSAAQGYVELEGDARWLPGPQIRSPLSGEPCCWWRYRIEQRQTHTWYGRRTTRWRTIASGVSDELFLLTDATGECIVDPHGARVHPSVRRTWRGPTPRPGRRPDGPSWLQFGDYRYHEELLQVGDPVYALGWFHTPSTYESLDETSALIERLQQYKRDRNMLLARFDADGNGYIDAQEWEQARRAALKEVRAERLQRALDPDLHVLCRPPDRRPYLLSTLTQAALARRYRAGFAILFVFSIISWTCSIFAVLARGWP